MMYCTRYEDGILVIPKALVKSPISAYENTLEVESVAALEEIISDPDSMRMQALLVRERILGPAHPDTSYYIRYRYDKARDWIFSDNLNLRGAVYADMGHFERCITLWMYALDMQQKILEPLSPMTQSSLLSFAELFSFMVSEGGLFYKFNFFVTYNVNIFVSFLSLLSCLLITGRSRGQVPFANLGGGARANAELPSLMTDKTMCAQDTSTFTRTQAVLRRRPALGPLPKSVI